nr:uncharacterized protein LOC109167867 [Ipomoea trifida]
MQIVVGPTVSNPVTNVNQTLAVGSEVDVPTIVVTEQKRRRTYEEDLEHSHVMSVMDCDVLESWLSSFDGASATSMAIWRWGKTYNKEFQRSIDSCKRRLDQLRGRRDGEGLLAYS